MSVDERDARRAEVREWIETADVDNEVVRLCLGRTDPLAGPAPYHAQQAAEKLIKAGLLLFRRSFRKTHDLDELSDALVSADPAFRDTVAELRSISFWNFAYRYPGTGHDEPPPSASELEASLQNVLRLRSELVALLSREGGPVS